MSLVHFPEMKIFPCVLSKQKVGSEKKNKSLYLLEPDQRLLNQRNAQK